MNIVILMASNLHLCVSICTISSLGILTKAYVSWALYQKRRLLDHRECHPIDALAVHRAVKHPCVRKGKNNEHCPPTRKICARPLGQIVGFMRVISTGWQDEF
jgi:hypothetical protein